MFWTKIIIPVGITLFEKEKRFLFSVEYIKSWIHSKEFDNFDLVNMAQSYQYCFILIKILLKGDTFFILTSGQVRVTQQIEDEPEPREIRILKQGDFFGEKALLGEEVCLHGIF